MSGPRLPRPVLDHDLLVPLQVVLQEPFLQEQHPHQVKESFDTRPAPVPAALPRKQSFVEEVDPAKPKSKPSYKVPQTIAYLSAPDDEVEEASLEGGLVGGYIKARGKQTGSWSNPETKYCVKSSSVFYLTPDSISKLLPGSKTIFAPGIKKEKQSVFAQLGSKIPSRPKMPGGLSKRLEL